MFYMLMKCISITIIPGLVAENVMDYFMFSCQDYEPSSLLTGLYSLLFCFVLFCSVLFCFVLVCFGFDSVGRMECMCFDCSFFPR